MVAAIASLYDDKLRPYGRIVRKRLMEHRSAKARPAAGVSMVEGQDLRGLCERSRRLRVEPEEGGEWSALLLNRDECFIDIYSEDDPYPPKMWEAAAAYFEGLMNESSSDPDGAGSSGKLPGGRYASARELLAREPAFLAGRSFGEVCHIMQLAISQKRLLGYFDGAVVPFAKSTSMEKQRCARQQRPCRGSDVSGRAGAEDFKVVDWCEARDCLRTILAEAVASGQKQVPLSNVKRLFRSKYRLELSETMLGHAKISDLLKDRRFADICYVDLQDRGYAVVPAPPGIEAPSLESLLEDSEAPSAGAAVEAELAQEPPAPMSGAGEAGSESIRTSQWLAARTPAFISPEGMNVKNTFFCMPPTPTGPSARYRAASLPKDYSPLASMELRPVDSPSSTQAQRGTPSSTPTAQQVSPTARTPPLARRKPMPLDDDSFGGFSPSGEAPKPAGGEGDVRLEAFGMADASPDQHAADPDQPARIVVPKTPQWLDDCEDSGFPMQTPSPQWATSKCLLGRSSPNGSPKNSAVAAAAVGATGSSPQIVSLAALIPGGPQVAMFSTFPA